MGFFSLEWTGSTFSSQEPQSPSALRTAGKYLLPLSLVALWKQPEKRVLS